MLTSKRHKNSGPKFGIGLLPRQLVRPIRSLNERLAPEPEDLLHIPTPWHNCILRLEHDPMLYLVKSGLVQEALQSKEFNGEWVTSEKGGDGGQGHFHLKSEQKTNELVKVGRQTSRIGNGAVFGPNVKLDIHLLKEGLRLKMLAITSAEKGTVASTAGGGGSGANGDNGFSATAKSTKSCIRPVRFLRWAFGRVFGLRLLRWLRCIFQPRAKVS